MDPFFDPLKPEALLYERDQNGKFKLVGVEYIVIDVGQPHPYFGDHPFDVGGTPVPVDHYSLHVTPKYLNQVVKEVMDVTAKHVIMEQFL